jgi:hypothetical protein
MHLAVTTFMKLSIPKTAKLINTDKEQSYRTLGVGTMFGELDCFQAATNFIITAMNFSKISAYSDDRTM